MKKLIGILLIGILAFSLCSCSLEYGFSNEKTVDGVRYFFSKQRKICFAADYAWNETDEAVTIRIPDEVEAYKVVALGGFVGRGVPVPFGISLPDAEAAGDVDCLEEGTVIKKIPVTIQLGKNVKRIDCVDMDLFLQTEDGTYIFLAEFEADDENPYFKADENGKLTYSKYSSDRIDKFLYKTDE